MNDRAELAARARRMQRAHQPRAHAQRRHPADPGTTYIDEGVVIGADTEIGPMDVAVGRRTSVGRNVTIGQGCVLTPPRSATGRPLKPYSVLRGGRGRASAVIWARSPACGPGTELAEERAHLGNFVETKKARMGKGTKANHLAYLGDAKIGAGVNVGAGTITCNYDGVNKHQTVLERRRLHRLGHPARGPGDRRRQVRMSARAPP